MSLKRFFSIPDNRRIWYLEMVFPPFHLLTLHFAFGDEAPNSDVASFHG